MKHKIELGSWLSGGSACIDLDRLLETRALIQANSGGGKSWKLRRLLEQTAGKVPQIVIDPEGEFSTLREQHDLVIAAAHGGDALAHPKTAKILAERLLETRVSAVLDIYDLKKHDRETFVRIFLESLMSVPKHLYGHLLIVLDEAQLFCPQKGSGESQSTAAVIDIATRGRKRGYCLVAATQRISKLNKDVAAELLNKFVGRTGLDLDVKRAAFELGMTPKEALAALQNLTAGQFYAFGPAISTSVQLMKSGAIETTHPKVGDRQLRAPPRPTEAIKAILPKLADLPKEAEDEARTTEELRRALANAKRELTQVQRQQSRPVAPIDTASARRDAATIKRLQGAIEALMKFVININAAGFAQTAGVDPQAMQKAIEAAVGQAMQLVDANLAGREKALQNLQREGGRLIASVQKLLADQEVRIDVDVKHNEPFTVAPARGSSPVKTPASTAAKRPANGAGEALPKGESATLAACIQFPDGLQRNQLTVLTGYKRSSRDAYIQRLRERGYVETVGDRVTATDAGVAALPDAEPLPTGQALQDYWLERLPEGERKILGVLLDAHPNAVARAELDSQTGYQRSSRDAYLQRLRAKQLIIEPSRGEVKAAADLF